MAAKNSEGRRRRRGTAGERRQWQRRRAAKAAKANGSQIRRAEVTALPVCGVSEERSSADGTSGAAYGVYEEAGAAEAPGAAEGAYGVYAASGAPWPPIGEGSQWGRGPGRVWRQTGGGQIDAWDRRH